MALTHTAGDARVEYPIDREQARFNRLVEYARDVFARPGTPTEVARYGLDHMRAVGAMSIMQLCKPGEYEQILAAIAADPSFQFPPTSEREV